MSDNENFGFGKFVPGFDFLQNLARGASQALPQLPNLSNWVAPTLNLEELEKRIGELRAVHFWLDQNSKALGATIQALEVQKMTLATLKGMNFNMGDVANALKLKPADTLFAGSERAGGGADAARSVADAAAGDAAKRAARSKSAKAAPARPTPSGVVDPLQWWSALTQQFQQIAATAMKDVATQTAVDTARNRATGASKEAMKTGAGTVNAAPAGGRKPTARRRPAKKAGADR